MYDYSDIKYVIFTVDWYRQTIIYLKIRIQFWKLGGCIDTWETCIKNDYYYYLRFQFQKIEWSNWCTGDIWCLTPTTYNLEISEVCEGYRNVKTLGGDKFIEWSKSNPPIMNRVNYVICHDCQSPYLPGVSLIIGYPPTKF